MRTTEEHEGKLTAIDILTGLLNAKDEELSEAREKIAELERRLRSAELWWAVPVKLSPAEASRLPVPRLEIVWVRVEACTWIADYRIVFRHLLGHVMAHPLGRTTCTLGAPRDVPESTLGKFDLPFRVGAHIRNEARQLNLPTFVVFGGRGEPIAW